MRATGNNRSAGRRAIVLPARKEPVLVEPGVMEGSSMKRVFNAASLVVVLAMAVAGCAGRGRSTLAIPAVPASVTNVPHAVERAPADASGPITTSGGATCGGAGLVAVSILCSGPPGSKATLNFSVDRLGPFGLPPTRCSGVTWQTTTQTFAPTAGLAHARAPRALGDAYYCDTSTSYALSVSASGSVGSVTIAHAFATYTVCFDLPINPCAPSGIVGPTIAIAATAPGSGGDGGSSGGGNGGSGGGGGGSSCGASVQRAPAARRRPFTGVIGGGDGSPSPVPTAASTSTPAPTPTPTIVPAPSPTPSAPSSCSPAGSLPAPESPKDRYTASRLAEVALPLTDAAGSDQGWLRWQVSGDTGTFENVRFDTDLTTRPPHANTLRLRVPVPIASRDYTLRLRVTSATGKTSQDKTIVLTVVKPAAYETELNAQDVFEQDDAGNVIQADASRYTAGDDNVAPDFGIRVDVPGITPSSRQRRPSQFSGSFDPLNPPEVVGSQLHQYADEKKFGCWSYLIDDNEAHDRTSPTSRGTLQVYAYCTNFWAAPGVELQQDGTNFNTGEQRHRVPLTLLPCARQIGLYGSYHVCATGLYGIQPVMGHAERVDIRYRLDFGALFGLELATFHTGHYEVNDRGAFYPKIPIQRSWTVQSVFDRGGGYVPFPDGPFYYCPASAQTPCLTESERAKLKGILRKAGAVPPAGFQAHHIHPVAWCGTNDPGNGVFLPAFTADGNEYNLKSHSRFDVWWARRYFQPDDIVRRCDEHT
jgi:hypothetical protein